MKPFVPLLGLAITAKAATAIMTSKTSVSECHPVADALLRAKFVYALVHFEYLYFAGRCPEGVHIGKAFRQAIELARKSFHASHCIEEDRSITPSNNQTDMAISHFIEANVATGVV
jgi:hypothetical protein